MSEAARSEGPSEESEVERLVEQCQTPLLRYARRLIRDADSAEDVVQEAFLRYIKSASRPDRPKAALNWLFRVVHNLCVDLIRKEQAMRKGVAEAPPAPVAASPARPLEAEETRRFLDGLLGRLTENQRSVIALKFQEDKTYREIHEITGLSISNIGVLIHHGLKKLGEMVRHEEALEK